MYKHHFFFTRLCFILFSLNCIILFSVGATIRAAPTVPPNPCDFSVSTEAVCLDGDGPDPCYLYPYGAYREVVTVISDTITTFAIVFAEAASDTLFLETQLSENGTYIKMILSDIFEPGIYDLDKVWPVEDASCVSYCGSPIVECTTTCPNFGAYSKIYFEFSEDDYSYRRTCSDDDVIIRPDFLCLKVDSLVNLDPIHYGILISRDYPYESMGCEGIFQSNFVAFDEIQPFLWDSIAVFESEIFEDNHIYYAQFGMFNANYVEYFFEEFYLPYLIPLGNEVDCIEIASYNSEPFTEINKICVSQLDYYECPLLIEDKFILQLDFKGIPNQNYVVWNSSMPDSTYFFSTDMFGNYSEYLPPLFSENEDAEFCIAPVNDLLFPICVIPVLKPWNSCFYIKKPPYLIEFENDTMFYCENEPFNFIPKITCVNDQVDICETSISLLFLNNLIQETSIEALIQSSTTVIGPPYYLDAAVNLININMCDYSPNMIQSVYSGDTFYLYHVYTSNSYSNSLIPYDMSNVQGPWVLVQDCAQSPLLDIDCPMFEAGITIIRNDSTITHCEFWTPFSVELEIFSTPYDTFIVYREDQIIDTISTFYNGMGYATFEYEPNETNIGSNHSYYDLSIHPIAFPNCAKTFADTLYQGLELEWHATIEYEEDTLNSCIYDSLLINLLSVCIDPDFPDACESNYGIYISAFPNLQLLGTMDSARFDYIFPCSDNLQIAFPPNILDEDQVYYAYFIVEESQGWMIVPIPPLIINTESSLQQDCSLPCSDMILNYNVSCFETNGPCSPIIQVIDLNLQQNFNSDIGIFTNLNSDTTIISSGLDNINVEIGPMPLDFNLSITVFLLENQACTSLINFSQPNECELIFPLVYIGDFPEASIQVCNSDDFAMNFSEICSYLDLENTCAESGAGFILSTDIDLMDIIAFDPINFCESDSGFLFSNELFYGHDTLYLSSGIYFEVEDSILPFSNAVAVIPYEMEIEAIPDFFVINCDSTTSFTCPYPECNWFNGDTGTLYLTTDTNTEWGWVDITDSMGCTIRDSFNILRPICGIAVENLQPQYCCYPNPFNESLLISTAKDSPVRVQIIDLCGRIVFEEYYYTKEDIVVNLGYLNSGVYFVEIYDRKNDKYYLEKVVKM